jgi:hypothetical protein
MEKFAKKDLKIKIGVKPTFFDQEFSALSLETVCREG